MEITATIAGATFNTLLEMRRDGPGQDPVPRRLQAFNTLLEMPAESLTNNLLYLSKSLSILY